MDSNTAVMSRDYGSTNMSDVPLTSSVECIREGTRIDGAVRLKPKKNDSLPRFFRKRKESVEYGMSSKEELKPESSRSGSLGRRLQYRISQMRNPPGAPVESLKTSEPIETKKSGLRSAISGYWSSIFKKTPREAGEIVQPSKEELPRVTRVETAIAESLGQTIVDTAPATKDQAPEIPKVIINESEELEKTVKGTTQEVYVG